MRPFSLNNLGFSEEEDHIYIKRTQQILYYIKTDIHLILNKEWSGSLKPTNYKLDLQKLYAVFEIVWTDE